jgi:hypothetical protein
MRALLFIPYCEFTSVQPEFPFRHGVLGKLIVDRRLYSATARSTATVFDQVAETKPVRGLFKIFTIACAVGIFTGCRTLVTSFNRVHDMMTKEETPEETHHYGAFFTSPLSMTSELPSERCGPGFRTSINGPEGDLADPDF